MLVLWLEFAAIAGLVILAGSRLSFYADVIAEKSGMGRTWTGIILLASMTSLPELITGASSVAVAAGAGTWLPGGYFFFGALRTAFL